MLITQGQNRKSSSKPEPRSLPPSFQKRESNIGSPSALDDQIMSFASDPIPISSARNSTTSSNLASPSKPSPQFSSRSGYLLKLEYDETERCMVTPVLFVMTSLLMNRRGLDQSGMPSKRAICMFLRAKKIQNRPLELLSGRRRIFLVHALTR